MTARPTGMLLDSANIEEIEKAVRTSAISGVTTNPSLVAKEKKTDYKGFIATVFNHVFAGERCDHFSFEVTTLDANEMYRQAVDTVEFLKKHYGSAARDIIYVKIPVALYTLPVITKLYDEDINVNATACMQPLQAKMASDAGAETVSFFFNRMKDGGEDDPGTIISDFRCIDNKDTTVICGSIRQPRDVWDCWRAGADYVTAPMNVIAAMMEHHKTTEAINEFQEDIEAWLK